MNALAAAPTEIPPPELIQAERARRHLTDFVRQGWPVIEPATPFVPGWHIDAIAEHLEAVTAGQIRNLLINMPPRHMKPVYNGSMILLASGRSTELENVVVGDVVATHTGRFRRVTAVHDQGELPTLAVTTDSGRRVIAALDHPFLTPAGWVQAQHLREGDMLALVVPEDKAAIARSNEEFRLAGYFVGDGTCREYPPKYKTPSLLAAISCADPLQGEDIQHCAQAMGFIATASKSASHRQYNLKGGIRPWLYATGLAGQGSHTKRVPAFVFEGNREQVSHFVGAYFACDGTLSKKGGARRDMALSFASVNRPLLMDVQHLLLRLGVRSRIRTKVSASTYTNGPHTSYVLEVTSQDDAAKFTERVPVFGGKAARLTDWGVRRTAFDNSLIPDRIVAIEDSGLKPCRCLTVEEDHSFLISDIAVHNSIMVSVCWPVWEWITFPERRWLFASYAQSLSTRDSLKCRRLIQSPWFQARWGDVFQLTSDQNAKIRFDNDKTGYRLASSVGGAVTGEGGDRIVVDDPHNALEAESETVRLNVLDWWDGSMSTRLNDPKTGSFVVVMQRVHEQDLSGHILEQGDFEHLCLPAEYEGAKMVTGIGWSDPRTEPGELLWPAQFGKPQIDALKVRMGSYKASGQLQQLPAPAEGGMVKRAWWRFWQPKGADYGPVTFRAGAEVITCPVVELPESFDEEAQSWDFAVKDTKSSDFVAGGVWGRKSADAYLLDLVHDRLDIMASIAAVRGTSAKWPNALLKLVEDKANGPAVIGMLQRELTGLVAWTPDRDKVARLVAVVPSIEAGNVILPHPRIAPWVFAFIDEVSKFPNAAHDDMVDQMTQILLRWFSVSLPFAWHAAAESD